MAHRLAQFPQLSRRLFFSFFFGCTTRLVHLSSLIRDRTPAVAMKALSPNHRTWLGPETKGIQQLQLLPHQTGQADPRSTEEANVSFIEKCLIGHFENQCHVCRCKCLKSCLQWSLCQTGSYAKPAHSLPLFSWAQLLKMFQGSLSLVNFHIQRLICFFKAESFFPSCVDISPSPANPRYCLLWFRKGFGAII